MRISLWLLILMAAMQTGCGAFKPFGSDDRARGCAGTDCTTIASRFKSSNGVAKQSQVFAAFKSCLGLPDAAVSAQTKSIFQTIKMNFSAEGSVNDVNSPMMMAQTQLAGEFCNDLHAHEHAATGKKVFFDQFNVPGTLNATINRFAKACWGREPMSFETVKIAELFTNSSVGTRTDKGAALFLCSLTLSSPDVLVY